MFRGNDAEAMAAGIRRRPRPARTEPGRVPALKTEPELVSILPIARRRCPLWLEVLGMAEPAPLLGYW